MEDFRCVEFWNGAVDIDDQVGMLLVPFISISENFREVIEHYSFPNSTGMACRRGGIGET